MDRNIKFNRSITGTLQCYTTSTMRNGITLKINNTNQLTWRSTLNPNDLKYVVLTVNDQLPVELTTNFNNWYGQGTSKVFIYLKIPAKIYTSATATYFWKKEFIKFEDQFAIFNYELNEPLNLVLESNEPFQYYTLDVYASDKKTIIFKDRLKCLMNEPRQWFKNEMIEFRIIPASSQCSIYLNGKVISYTKDGHVCFMSDLSSINQLRTDQTRLIADLKYQRLNSPSKFIFESDYLFINGKILERDDVKSSIEQLEQRDDLLTVINDNPVSISVWDNKRYVNISPLVTIKGLSIFQLNDSPTNTIFKLRTFDDFQQFVELLWKGKHYLRSVNQNNAFHSIFQLTETIESVDAPEFVHDKFNINRYPLDKIYTFQPKDIDDGYDTFAKDLDLTFKQDWLINESAIKLSLFHLIYMNKQDRPLKPYLDLEINGKLFELEGNQSLIIIRDYIENLVKQVEPRVKIKLIDKLSNSTANEMHLVFEFSIEGNKTFSFNFVIKRT